MTSVPIVYGNGFYLTYNDASHQTPIYLNTQKLNYHEVVMNWELQGGDDGYRCSNGNWIPLNGPGYNGGSTSYQAPCLAGYNCIQGFCQDGRDAPIAAQYTNNNIKSADLLTWSGSSTGTIAGNCARSTNIPTSDVALWFTKLLLR